MTDTPVTVIFRRWKDGLQTVIAIFPEIDAGDGLVQMYEHVGQHGGGDYGLVIDRTTSVRSTDVEVEQLKQELEDRGYTLRVRQRVNANTMRTIR
jgi:hypothetical protein